MIFLQMHGIGTARAVRIYKTYGQKSIELIQADPYRLALDIRGIGFKTADQLAERLGVPRDATLRLQAGLRHVLQEQSSEGHCAVPRLLLIEKTCALLEIESEKMITALEAEIQTHRVISEQVRDQDLMFLSGFYRAEIGLAAQIHRLSQQKLLWRAGIQIDESIASLQMKASIRLSESQEAAIRLVLSHPLSIITGGPGVGKTTLVQSVVRMLSERTQRILLAAPTGRAAKRLSDATGIEAKTLHRLLEFDPRNGGFKRDQHCPLEADLIVIDEVSMVDLLLMYALLKAIPLQAMVVFVGDVDQLPSVGPGTVLSDLIASHQVPTVYLKEIFRQAKKSHIVLNAHRVNQGHLPEFHVDPKCISDFYFIKADTPELIHQKLITLVKSRMPQRFHLDPIRDIQVLAPMNRGGLGARSLNVELQKVLNPHVGHTVTRFGSTYGSGDKVIQTVNNYQKEIFNGDIGFITTVNLEEGLLSVLFEGRLVHYEFNEIDELSLAYATTIHKSQGSEYPAVVIPIAMQHYKLLQRNLLYTGITRGKSLVVIVGQLKALWMAIRNQSSDQRLTCLKERLIEAAPVALLSD